MKFHRTSIVILVVSSVLGVGSVAHAQSSEHTLTVIASGSSSAAADRVSLQLTVTSQDPTATGLFVKQNDVVGRLKKTLEGAGVKPEEIDVQPFRLLPNMEYGQAGTRIISYRMDTPLEVTIDDVKDLPRLIDLATANGAGSVAVGSFSMSGGRSLHDDAMKSAIANARKEAAGLAKSMGKSIGDIVSISETEDAGKGAPAGGGGEEEEEKREMKKAQQAQPNTLTEKAELKVVFELK